MPTVSARSAPTARLMDVGRWAEKCVRRAMERGLSWHRIRIEDGVTVYEGFAEKPGPDDGAIVFHQQQERKQ